MTDKLTQLAALKPRRFGYLVSLSMMRDIGPEGASPYTLVLVLADATPPTEMLTLTFTGVAGAEIGSVDGLWNWFVEIRDVGERQLEGIRYRVVESEHSALKLWCADFLADVGAVR